MSYSLIVDRPWRYRHPRRGAQTLPPGRYRVPEEIAEPIAVRALADGMAKREATFGEKFVRAAAAAPLAVVAARAPDSTAAPKPRPRRASRKKALATQPENANRA